MDSVEKFQLSYSVSEDMNIEHMKSQFQPSEEDTNSGYNPYNNLEVNKYNPLYSVFFNMDSSNYNKIGFDNQYQIVDLKTVKNIQNGNTENKDIFIKFSPLLDPIRYMIGKYDVQDDNIRTLPKYNDNENVHEKLLNENNSSYVDNFFSFLSSKLLHNYKFSNGIDFYGSFLTVQDKYKINVSDDFDYLGDSNYFSDNLNKLFSVSRFDLYKQYLNCSRTNRNKLNISSNNIEELDSDIVALDEADVLLNKVEELGDLEEIYAKEPVEGDGESDDEDDSDIVSDEDEEYDGDDDDNSDEEDDESAEDSEMSIGENVFAYINNFPVQMICLEKCDGTLDELFENSEIDEMNGSAALLQVILSLLIYQKTFQFTHNDLHTNNIVYKTVDQEFVYYKFNNVYYKVPTYGKMFKIIDFGRSIYKYQGKIFCSDSFAPGGDASTQYNCEPFYNKNKPRIDPNMSFDLCRLGCSIYDFIIDDENYEDMNELQKTVYRWCTDDNDLNILYKKNGNERYPNFKLYKMIARTVHKHTPERQLNFEFFNKYAVSDLDENAPIIDIDAMHSYA